MGEDLHNLAAANYPRIAAELIGPLLDFVRTSREVCRGDLDKAIVMMAIGLRTTRHRDFAMSSPAELDSGQLAVLPGFGSFAQAIALSLGMPKETVRRKVSDMVSAGWLVRRERRLYVTGKAYQDFAASRAQLLRLATTYHQIISEIAAESKPKA